jgi:hypothetical protein
MFLNDDNPHEAYNNEDLCFVAQPLKDNNISYNNIVVPLMMCDMWDIICDNPNLISQLRGNEKKYEFGFVGSCVNARRDILRHLRLESFLFETDMVPIWNMSREQKHKNIKDYLYKMSQCKFVFAPRGLGSSSFRLYESLSVGSIPIITGDIELPFNDQVMWDSFSVRGDIENLHELASDCSDMCDTSYCRMRIKAMEFWDNYCIHDKLYVKLSDIINNKKN